MITFNMKLEIPDVMLSGKPVMGGAIEQGLFTSKIPRAIQCILRLKDGILLAMT